MRMDAPGFLTELCGRGVVVEASGDRLRVNAPRGVLSESDWERLRALKSELLALLTAAAHTPSISPADPLPPAGPCDRCHSPRSWLAPGDRWLCATCHPPERGATVYRHEGYDAAPAPTLPVYRESYAKAASELAEALGWPELPYQPGHAVAAGEIRWRQFLYRAALPVLRDEVLPVLRARLAEYAMPGKP